MTHPSVSPLCLPAIVAAFLPLWVGPAHAAQDGAESRVLEQARSGIERHRKADAVVVVTRAGKPIAGATVKVAQTRQAFLFGCSFIMGKTGEPHELAYRSRLAALFNFATPGYSLQWGHIERHRGWRDFRRADAEVTWCRSNGITVKGHRLTGIGPKWMFPRRVAGIKRLPFTQAQVKQLVDAHIRGLMTRYRGQIPVWDALNEPVNWQGWGVDPRLHMDHWLRLMRQIDPDVTLVVNEFGVMAGRLDPAYKAVHKQFYAFLEGLNERGVPYDAIGLQAHTLTDAWFAPSQVQQTLDSFKPLGKAIHITELAMGGFRNEKTGRPTHIRGGYRAGRWTPELQADYYEEFLTVCFGHPLVTAVTVWDLSESRSGGLSVALLDENMEPRPAYHRLMRLVRHDWWTTVEGTTDGEGRYPFRGFLGQYQVRVASPDGTELGPRDFRLVRESANRWQVETNP